MCRTFGNFRTCAIRMFSRKQQQKSALFPFLAVPFFACGWRHAFVKVWIAEERCLQRNAAVNPFVWRYGFVDHDIKYILSDPTFEISNIRKRIGGCQPHHYLDIR